MKINVILTLFYLTGNEEQGWVMKTHLIIGNEVTDFLKKPGSLSSPSMKTLYTLFSFLSCAGLFSLKANLHAFRGY